MRFLPRPRPDADDVDPGSLLTSGLPHLLDERSDPDFRSVFGLLVRRSAGIDTAVARIRLGGLDLRPSELNGVDRIRVLLAQVSALTLRSEAEATLVDPAKATNLENVVALVEEGRIEIRSAPLAGWSPDFTVFHRTGRAWTVLVGLHWFARPYPHRGPALASLHGPGAAARSARRFSELWATAHDIRPAILALLKKAERRSGRGADPARRPPLETRARTGSDGRMRPARLGRTADSTARRRP